MGAFADLLAELDARTGRSGVHFFYEPQEAPGRVWSAAFRGHLAFGRTGEEALRALVSELREAGGA